METLNVSVEQRESMKQKLSFIYKDDADAILKKVLFLIEKYKDQYKDKINAKSWITEEDVILITYGDSIIKEGELPLSTLYEFLNEYIKDTITSVHILPFYPYSSDDGFSVIDYREVNEALGTWTEIKTMSKNFDLMFDAVINHISKSSEWFQGYLRGDKKYQNYFIEANPEDDLSQVVRPRALPLLTPFNTSDGSTKHIWTTFSEDQIDINFANPDVLIEILDIMAMYGVNGARFIRLDAIGFLWKKIGTSCIHLEETHMVVKLIREILDIIIPGIILISETNVPHQENISYFGNGYDEAQMVYQFPLPPLTLFSFHSKSARKLMEWMAQLGATTDSTSYFNFLSSHDGIGMRPTEGILTEDEKQLMVDKAIAHGGLVSYKNNPDGSKSPYELNINYLDALTHPDDTEQVRVDRALAAHTILLSIVGVPGIYIHSLIGSRNDYEGVKNSGINRRINREKLDKHLLDEEMNSTTFRSKVFNGLTHLINIRKQHKAFNPKATQQVLFIDDRVFSIIREHEETSEKIVILVNVSDDYVELNTELTGIDLIQNSKVTKQITLYPYQTMWIK